MFHGQSAAQAEVRVLGTQLVVSVNPAATQVEVREGRDAQDPRRWLRPVR